jgi:hypothetical protein
MRIGKPVAADELSTNGGARSHRAHSKGWPDPQQMLRVGLAVGKDPAFRTGERKPTGHRITCTDDEAVDCVEVEIVERGHRAPIRRARPAGPGRAAKTGILLL